MTIERRQVKEASLLNKQNKEMQRLEKEFNKFLFSFSHLVLLNLKKPNVYIKKNLYHKDKYQQLILFQVISYLYIYFYLFYEAFLDQSVLDVNSIDAKQLTRIHRQRIHEQKRRELERYTNNFNFSIKSRLF